MSDRNITPTVHPLVKYLSRLWLIPRREYLRRFRLGRTVLEKVADNDIVVLPQVFNPVIFRTGEYFATMLQKAELPAMPAVGEEAPMALDLGTGTGVLAIVAARRGFRVDAVDLNPEAVRCVRINVALNSLDSQVNAHQGDLFEPVAGKKYDLITFSPPSFRGEPTSNLDLSWRSIDVFERFAMALPSALKLEGVAMVLQTSHGDEVGLLAALDSAGLQVEILARKHLGVEILTVYGVSHPRD